MIIPINGRHTPYSQSYPQGDNVNSYTSKPARHNSIRPGREKIKNIYEVEKNWTLESDSDLDQEYTERDSPEEEKGFSPVEAVEQEEICNGDDQEDWKESFIRLRADFDNYKRNTEKDKNRSVGLGKEAVLDDIFPLVEHLERALKTIEASGGKNDILQGMEIVYKEVLKVLEKHGIERIKTIGELFDPKLHEAVALSPKGDNSEDTITAETRAGFVKLGKLLRPAAVVVAK